MDRREERGRKGIREEERRLEEVGKRIRGELKEGKEWKKN